MSSSSNAHRARGRDRLGTPTSSPGVKSSRIRTTPPSSKGSASNGGASPRHRNRNRGGGAHPQQPILTQSPSAWTGSVSTTSLPQRHILPAPRTVTPTATTSMSWEDLDEGIYGTTQRNNRGGRRDAGELLNEYPDPSPTSSFSSEHRRTTVEYDEDMPMDEMADAMKMHGKPQQQASHVVSPRISDQLEPVRRGRGLGATKSFEYLVSPTEIKPSSHSKNRPPMPPGSGQDVVSIDRGIGTISPATVEIDDISSLGATAMSAEDRDASTPLSRMMWALKQKSGRPSHLNPEERALWDCIQQVLATQRTEQHARRRALERQLQDSSAKLQDSKSKNDELQKRLASSEEPGSSGNSRTQLEGKLKETQRLLQERESEHDLEIRAIQRVLADVTTEREVETEAHNSKFEKLNAEVQTSQDELRSLQEKNKMLEQKLVQAQNVSTPLSPSGKSEEGATLKEKSQQADSLEAKLLEARKSFEESESGRASVKKELERKSRRLMGLERDYRNLKVQLSKNEVEKTKVTNENESLKKQLEQTKKTAKESDEVTKTPKPTQDAGAQATKSEEVEALQKSLRETSSSLENAKKIIASLENANGSLATDLRAKLKGKEEELAAIQIESNDRKRHLDSLATELRDLQRKQGDVQRAEQEGKAQVLRFKALSSQLAQSVSELQSASVVHEVSTATGTADRANVDHVAEILSDTMTALKATMESADDYVDTYDDHSVVAFTDVDTLVNSEVGRQVDALIQKDREAAAKDLRQGLEQKQVAVKRLEDALKKQNEEVKRLRSQVDTMDRGSEETNNRLQAEIQSLREQCTTNMEVLAKKERELSVLRSSLKVDDDDGGYISDDVSDGEDEPSPEQAVASPTRLNGYDPSQTEALATILSHTGAGIDVPGRAQELETMKSELSRKRVELERAAKDLQEERESLANAKMIISSLEKANKSMMEDLRSRLQDSNTAIASLLDKSVENEKTTASLRTELATLKKEREEEQEMHLEEVKKLKGQSTALNSLDDPPGESGKAAALEEKKEEPDDDASQTQEAKTASS